MKTKRISLDVTEDALIVIKSLMEELNITTYKELFNNSVTILKWLKEKKANGYSIGAYHESTDRYIELSTPVLDHIKQK
jgi:hypothetical protein